MRNNKITSELLEEAKKNPSGWVYVLDKEYVEKEDVPPEFIKGAWKVNGDGEIEGDFLPKKNNAEKTRMVSSIESKKLNWTRGMAIVSFGLIVMIILIDIIKEPLLGLKDGYAPHNFGLNTLIIGPSRILSFILSLIVVSRIIKYWKIWPTKKSKYIILGLALPALLLYSDFLIRIFSI